MFHNRFVAIAALAGSGSALAGVDVRIEQRGSEPFVVAQNTGKAACSVIYDLYFQDGGAWKHKQNKAMSNMPPGYTFAEELYPNDIQWKVEKRAENCQ